MELKPNTIPLFCADVTEDEDNDKCNGAEFVTRTLAVKDTEENKEEQPEQSKEKVKMPKWAIAASVIGLGYCAIALFLGAREGLEQAINRSPVFFMTALLCGLVGSWILLYYKKKADRVEMEDLDEAYEKLEDALEEDGEEQFEQGCRELGVPEDACSMDILYFEYKVKRGKVQPYGGVLSSLTFMNFEYKVYATFDELCMTDGNDLYTFAKSEIKGIAKVDKRIDLPFWNHGDEPDEKLLDTYDIKKKKHGYGCKPYYVLMIEHAGQTYGIYFPCYELATVERLTGVRADRD